MMDGWTEDSRIDGQTDNQINKIFTEEIKGRTHIQTFRHLILLLYQILHILYMHITHFI